MAGMRPELYQRMLRELSEQIKLADELGYDSVSFTEHHFHIEGFEVSQNPVLLDLYFAMQTKRIRVGQLGIVLPAANPIRVAEDIAMLDHMTGGRAVAGFARGYQRRWVDIMAQQTHDIHGALPHQHDEVLDRQRIRRAVSVRYWQQLEPGRNGRPRHRVQIPPQTSARKR
jgi:alkanesulfonate monooxygenase SsuD/methylene tetrahydromethanopterin reductase-like flavin-dependent oxidoreductase (luciferase family)